MCFRSTRDAIKRRRRKKKEIYFFIIDSWHDRVVFGQLDTRFLNAHFAMRRWINNNDKKINGFFSLFFFSKNHIQIGDTQPRLQTWLTGISHRIRTFVKNRMSNVSNRHIRRLQYYSKNVNQYKQMQTLIIMKKSIVST